MHFVKLRKHIKTNYYKYLKMLNLFYPNKKVNCLKHQYNLETMTSYLPIVLKFPPGTF